MNFTTSLRVALNRAALWASAAGVATSLLLITAPGAQAQNQGRTFAKYGPYGEWTVEFLPADAANNIPAQCRAFRNYQHGIDLSIVAGEQLFAIDFSHVTTRGVGKSYEVTYWVDDPSIARSATAHLVKDAYGVDMMRIEEPTNEPGSEDALANGKRLIIKRRSNNEQWDFPLDHSNAAMKSLFNCKRELVASPQRATPAQAVTPPQRQAAPPPPPARPPQQGAAPSTGEQSYLVEWVELNGRWRSGQFPSRTPFCFGGGPYCGCSNACGVRMPDQGTLQFRVYGCQRPPVLIRCEVQRVR